MLICKKIIFIFNKLNKIRAKNKPSFFGKTSPQKNLWINLQKTCEQPLRKQVKAGGTLLPSFI